MTNAYVRRQEEVANDLGAPEPEKIRRDVECAIQTAGLTRADVLCVGTRDGADMRLFQERGCRVAGAELGAQAAERLRGQGLNVTMADAHRLSDAFGAARFDLVFARHVIEHCHSPEVALREMVKRLRPNGWLFLSCPKGRNENPHHYACWRDAEELAALLREYGMRVARADDVPSPKGPVEDEIVVVAQQETHKLAMINLSSPCNLACPYCYSNKGGGGKLPARVWRDFLERHGRHRWFANFCGTGETFLALDFGEICRLFTSQRNTLIISTNLSVPRVEDILESDPDYVVLLFSVHWEELERKGILSETLGRARRLADYGMAVSPTMVLTREIVPRIPEIAARVMGECGLRVGGKVLRDAGRHVLMEGRAREVCDEHLFMGWYDAELARDDVKGRRCSAGGAVCWVNFDGVVRACAPTEKVLGRLGSFEWSDVGTCPASQCACPLPFMLGSVKGLVPPADEYTIYNRGCSEALRARLAIEVS